MKFGIEGLLAQPQRRSELGRCALLCNQASVTQDFRSSWAVLHEYLGANLKAFFGPQHGFHATVQDNMIETGHEHAGPFGLPVYSLYSETREPRPEMLAGIDTVLIDLQIVGCRVYTFKYTIAACLRQAAQAKKRVIILDRPNPLNGVSLEGRVLSRGAESFVGEFPIPLRHGMTAAECALFFNQGIGAELSVVPMEGWQPEKVWSDQLAHWILTSPNLPTIDPVYVYPATVMLEGTNLSEGRGTGLPFQFVGAPYIKKSEAFVSRVNELYQGKGVFLRAAEFQPTSQKWAGEVCRGFQIHVLNPYEIASFRLGLAIMRAALELAPDQFAWKKPGYEYDFVNLPIDLILGAIGAHKKLEEGFSIDDSYWSDGLNQYQNQAEKHLLYPRAFTLS